MRLVDCGSREDDEDLVGIFASVNFTELDIQIPILLLLIKVLILNMQVQLDV